MSADLFAEFSGGFGTGAPSQSPQPQTQAVAPSKGSPNVNVSDHFSFLAKSTPQSQQAAPKWPSYSTQKTPAIVSGNARNDVAVNFGPAGHQSSVNRADEEDDTWGDFEVASPVVETAPSTAELPHRPSGHFASAIKAVSPPPASTRIVRAPTIDLISNSLLDFGGTSSHGEGSAGVAGRTPMVNSSRNALPPRPKNPDPNVLFDAEDYDPEAELSDEEEEAVDDEDDFGDFETVEVQPTPTIRESSRHNGLLDQIDFFSSEPAQPLKHAVSATPSVQSPPSELLSGLTFGAAAPATKVSEFPRSQERSSVPGLGLNTLEDPDFPGARVSKPSPVTPWSAQTQSIATSSGDGFGDEWDAFGTVTGSEVSREPAAATPDWQWDAMDDPQQSAVVPERRSSIKQATQITAEDDASWSWDATEVEPVNSASKPATPSAPAPLAASVPDNIPPPTNVPPPSILLSIFPSLLDLPSTSLFQPSMDKSSSLKSRVLSDPHTISFLRGFLLLATVAARIIAGRKLRWQRDKFLTQRMTISAAGGKGGMKLASIDKAQTKKDDQVTDEVLEIWKQHVGRLRSAVAAANSTEGAAQGGGGLRTPEINEIMSVQAVKMVPTAPKACLICGIKRDERIKGVDVDVEDSFGEWWVEHWGHRACRNFWLEHETSLRSR